MAKGRVRTLMVLFVLTLELLPPPLYSYTHYTCTSTSFGQFKNTPIPGGSSCRLDGKVHRIAAREECCCQDHWFWRRRLRASQAIQLKSETRLHRLFHGSSCCELLCQDMIVICGGVTLAGDRLFVPLRAEVQRRAFKPAVDACRIVPGELTGTAGVYGAAAVFVRHTWGRL